MRRSANKYLIISALILFSICSLAHADSVIKKDGSEVKGVVVEEYTDRIVFSTADGEIKFMKSDIRNIVLDDEDSNLMRLAENAKNEGDFGKAAAYYEKVLVINPNSKAAKDAILFLKLRSWQKQTAGKVDDVEKQAMMDRGGVPYAKTDEDAELAELKRNLEGSTGMALGSEANLPVVQKVRNGSPAYSAGIRRTDRIVAVWGRLTGYMTLRDVIDLILNKGSAEIRCTVERSEKVPLERKGLLPSGDRIGASLYIGPEGLAILSMKKGGGAESAGLQKKDVIVAINGMPTRYLQLGKALDIIRSAKGDSVDLKLRRETVIWKGGV